MHKITIRHFICQSLMLLLFCGSAIAQINVSGVVKDEKGQNLANVSIQVQGQSIITQTDDQGRFALEVPNQQVTLVFTSMGYKTQELVLGAQRQLTITLLASEVAIEETVVVGYGTQKKESVVAAISTMKAEGLKQTPAANIGIALAGRLPGLSVLQRSGVPGGENLEFYIRGRSTVNGQQPLILVDGVPRDFTALDPREVETISVLKDASATAVYGVRGANGVIIVTTRRGKSGKPIIDVSAEQTYQAPTRLPQMVNAFDYATLYNQVAEQNGRPAIYDQKALDHYRLGDFQELYPTRDFVHEFMKDSFPMKRLNVNVGGGSDRMKYFTTVGYLFQEGIFKTEKFDEYDYDPTSKANRVNFRSNFDININKSLDMFLNVSGYMQKKNDPVVVPNNGSYLNDVNAYSIVIGSLLQTPSNYHNDLTPTGDKMSDSYLVH